MQPEDALLFPVPSIFALWSDYSRCDFELTTRLLTKGTPNLPGRNHPQLEVDIPPHALTNESNCAVIDAVLEVDRSIVRSELVHGYKMTGLAFNESMLTKKNFIDRKMHGNLAFRFEN